MYLCKNIDGYSRKTGNFREYSLTCVFNGNHMNVNIFAIEVKRFRYARNLESAALDSQGNMIPERLIHIKIDTLRPWSVYMIIHAFYVREVAQRVIRKLGVVLYILYTFVHYTF